MWPPFQIGAAADHQIWAAAAVFFALLIAHALGDFALQGNFMARAKNRHADLSDFFPEKVPRGIWWNTLLAHCLIHAGGVWLVTGSVMLALVELVLHLVIDFARCEGWLSFSTDQMLHRLCKLGYAVLLFFQVPAWITWSPV